MIAGVLVLRNGNVKWLGVFLVKIEYKYDECRDYQTKFGLLAL